MAVTISGTDGIVGAGFTVDNSGVSVTAGVGTFGSIGAGTSIAASGLHGTMPTINGHALTTINAANLTGALPAISAASLTSIPAANIVGVCTSGLTKTGGFGAILQVKQTFKDDTTSTSGNSHSQISGLTVAITPSSSSNKILYKGCLYLASSASECSFRLTRTVGGSTTEIATPSTYQDDEDGTFHHGGGSRYGGHSFEFLDSPNTTSEITYGITWQTHSGTTYLNRTWDSGWFHGISTLTAMEVTP